MNKWWQDNAQAERERERESWNLMAAIFELRMRRRKNVGQAKLSRVGLSDIGGRWRYSRPSVSIKSWSRAAEWRDSQTRCTQLYTSHLESITHSQTDRQTDRQQKDGGRNSEQASTLSAMQARVFSCVRTIHVARYESVWLGYGA